MLAIQNGASNPVRISWKRSDRVKMAPVWRAEESHQSAPSKAAPLPRLQACGDAIPRLPAYHLLTLTSASARSRTYFAVTPATRMTLFRPHWPDAKVTED